MLLLFSSVDIHVELDEQICEQARLNYDARYDGRIFIGVTTTGVYCRPICPTPHAKRSHVQYFPTAAAAAQAGFRPCLRCRPEVAPGTPAWNGTSTTVNRGLRLIAEGALDEASVERLAERLGVTSRHLSRLFLRHLGALPTAVARTRRLHFAKQLISDTNLPMAQVALASGFGSIRRFNDVFREYYGRPPSELRRLGKRPGVADDEYVFQLAYRPPYAWNPLLEFLAARAIPGVEAVRDGLYRRTIALRDHRGLMEVTHRPERRALQIRLQLHRPELLLQAISRVRAMFDLNAAPELIRHDLRRDRLLAPYLRRCPGLRLPGAWDPFELIVHAILAQEAPLEETRALMGRLAERLGEPLTVAGGTDLTRTFPQPATLVASELADIPPAASRMIRDAARILRNLGPANPLDELMAKLEGIDGIGESTLQAIAMRTLNDPDALPFADRSLALAYASLGSAAGLRQHAVCWKPWRSYAAMYLMCASGN
jgi:AraC family transcriptional regulator of adaptative response / DNA-3-methyladenine glycosylase II